ARGVRRRAGMPRTGYKTRPACAPGGCRGQTPGALLLILWAILGPGPRRSGTISCRTHLILPLTGSGFALTVPVTMAEIAVIIDWHSHIYTPEEAADDLGTLDGKHGPKWGERGCPMVLENFLEAHYENGTDISVVTNAAHYLRGKADHEELLAVQKWSDYAAEVQQTYKGTLYSFATILPCGGPAFIKEAERAVRELGLKGIFIHSSHKGHYPDDDEARPFWELVQELDVPVMIHPPHLGFGEERM